MTTDYQQRDGDEPLAPSGRTAVQDPPAREDLDAMYNKLAESMAVLSATRVAAIGIEKLR